jgi:hypothetical protein
VEAYRVVILRIRHCLDSRLTDGGKVVNPTHNRVPEDISGGKARLEHKADNITTMYDPIV